MKQCFVLDKMRVNKEEMHRPLKHVLIDNKLKVVMLDFERTHETDKPKNLSQFLEYLKRDYVMKLLRKKGFKYNRKQLLNLSRQYKEDISLKNLKEIIKIFSS